MAPILRSALALTLVAGLSLAPAPARARRVHQSEATALYVFRVYLAAPEDVTRLTSGGWDVLEARGPNYLLVLGNAQTERELTAAGFVVRMEYELDTSLTESPLTYYSGYRTVAEHYAHLDAVAAAKPGLARVVDYGDSWGKLSGGPIQNDLKAICLTRLAPGDCALTPNSAKPRFLLMAAIHARELSTAEMAWRWMDYLAYGYETDPEVTALLDSTEVWVIPVANPDGRIKVEEGGAAPYLQRKNLNDFPGGCANPPTGSNQAGVDLNRNASFQWGVAGTSADPCSQVYLGASAASEPEQYSLEQLFRNLWPDQRGPALSDTAPLTATGAMLTLHTYSNLILLPWSWTECFGQPCPTGLRAPNDAGLRSFAFRMSFYNGYNTGQGSEILYAASGVTDDWAYGQLGVAGATFEIGPFSGTCSGFLPAYACQDSTFWPLNREAFLYAAKAARQPYALSLGPTPISPTLSALTVTAGSPVTVTVRLRDDAYGNVGVGRPAAQNIAAAELYVDTPPWAGGTPLALAAQDGAFDSPNEVAQGVLDTTGLGAGRHMLFVRGQDAAGNWGVTAAAFLWVEVSQFGVALSPATSTAYATAAGQMVTHTLTITNTGFFSDAFTLTLSGNAWPTSAPPFIALVALESRSFPITVTVPLTATLEMSDTVTVTARSGSDPANTAASTLITRLGIPLYLPLIAR